MKAGAVYGSGFFFFSIIRALERLERFPIDTLIPRTLVATYTPRILYIKPSLFLYSSIMYKKVRAAAAYRIRGNSLNG